MKVQVSQAIGSRRTCCAEVLKGTTKLRIAMRITVCGKRSLYIEVSPECSLTERHWSYFKPLGGQTVDIRAVYTRSSGITTYRVRLQKSCRIHKLESVFVEICRNMSVCYRRDFLIQWDKMPIRPEAPGGITRRYQCVRVRAATAKPVAASLMNFPISEVASRCLFKEDAAHMPLVGS